MGMLNKDCNPLSDVQKTWWKQNKEFSAKSMKIECDAHDLETTVYQDTECKGETTASFAIMWDSCTEIKIGEDKMWMKFTSAMALKAAAAAGLALIGSQF